MIPRTQELWSLILSSRATKSSQRNASDAYCRQSACFGAGHSIVLSRALPIPMRISKP